MAEAPLEFSHGPVTGETQPRVMDAVDPIMYAVPLRPEVREEVYALHTRIETAEKVLEYARGNPQDTLHERCHLNRLIKFDYNNVTSAQNEIAVHSRGPTCDEEAELRPMEKKLLKCLTTLADNIERAELSARTGTVITVASGVIFCDPTRFGCPWQW